jgi:ABC-type amino acid transport substrate-binding protein
MKFRLCLAVFLTCFAIYGLAGNIKDIQARGEIRHIGIKYANFVTGDGDAFDVYLRKIKADGSYDKLVDRYYPGIRQYFPEFFANSR